MTEPAELLGHIRYQLSRGGPLADRHVVVTAGGTQEAIDPVRSITNRSSGKQGYALAQAALDAGAQVTLISGPTALPAPVGAEFVAVSMTEEMLEAVLVAAKKADALLMAAAVADFKVKKVSKHKIKRSEGVPEVKLAPNPDILAEVGKLRSKRPTVVVGFAAESKDLLKNAKQKLETKKLDLMVANDISATDAGFEVDTNRVVLIDRAGAQDELPLMSKDEVARVVVDRVVAILAAKE
jgi:phosphopantothenoylcysteine decarboxylase/phosphopantothenate--cysteine ligase